LAPALAAQSEETISFKDPLGDDDGPGGYLYPTDPVYTSGSFDLTEFSVTTKGERVTFDVTVKAPLKDPWGLRSGFSVQMVFIFIRTNERSGSGFTESVPGLNVNFDPADAWDKLVILSPQPAVRIESEIELKVDPAMQSSIIVPDRAMGKGRTISAGVDLARLGGGDPAKWGYQVVMQSNEGFPENRDLLTRKVDEVEKQHRFGGGNDDNCDPHVIDVLAGNAAGGDDEIQAQHAMLKYACHPDGSTKKRAVLKMVRK
jgi:carbohydrate-binding DOMON domain-containing protein